MFFAFVIGCMYMCFPIGQASAIASCSSGSIEYNQIHPSNIISASHIYVEATYSIQDVLYVGACALLHAVDSWVTHESYIFLYMNISRNIKIN